MENTETPVRTWHLDESVIPDTIAKLKKLNAKATTRGLNNLYTWALGGEHREPVYDGTGTMTINGIPHYLHEGRPVPCELIGYEITREFTVTGHAPKLAGWTFLATLTWDGGTLVTRTVPGFTETIDPATLRPGECDHCRKARQRYDTYLVQNESGDRKQVGSSCVKDFLGHEFRPAWLRGSDDLDEIEERYARVRGQVDAATLDVLAWAAALTAKTGWISRAKAEAEYRNPSTEMLRDLLFGASAGARQARGEMRPTSEQQALAVQVLEWAKTVDASTSEYLANVQRLAQAEYVGERNVGILGSAVAAYHRAMTERAERAARPVSSWVGEVGGKVELTVTVRSDTETAGDYGVTHLYTLTDDAGNMFKWFSTRNQDWKPEQQVKIKGTVKAHDEYREVKQTVLTRCKVI